MGHRKEVVLRFIEHFCRGQFGKLGELLTEELRFRGPWLEADSRAAYLEALGKDSVEEQDFEVLSVFEEGEQVAVFYELIRPGRSVVVAQLNRFQGERIAEIQLVFNPGDFA